MWKLWLLAHSMPRGTKGTEEWSLPQNRGDYRQYGEMSWRRICGKNTLIKYIYKSKDLFQLHVPQLTIWQIDQVDVPSCSTPKRRPINLPSVASIEELRTPAFEELLKSFGDVVKQANGDVKHFSGSYETQLQSSRDSRVPLTAIN